MRQYILIATETAQAIQNPAGSAGGNDLLFTSRCKGAPRSDKNQEKAKGWCFYQPTLPESLQQSRAGRSIGFWCLFFGSFLWTNKEMNTLCDEIIFSFLAGG